MTTVGHPPRLLHDHAATHEVRNGTTRRMACRFTPDRVGIAGLRFLPRGEHNSQWYAVYCIVDA
jgi:hypothetical protein